MEVAAHADITQSPMAENRTRRNFKMRYGTICAALSQDPPLCGKQNAPDFSIWLPSNLRIVGRCVP
jgi:hypothetical protein